MENMMDRCAVIGQQLQQAIVLIGECVRLDLSKEQETKNGHETKLINLLKQIAVLQRWIQRQEAVPI